ncbi:MAG: outer membrane beta-barrel protein, partial [Pricia sp.]
MKRTFFVVFLSYTIAVSAQIQSDSMVQDTRYLEDQFYIGLTYNILLDKPENVSQRNLSYGLQGGFIKDIPLNKSRTSAFGVGLGYGVYSYYTNLRALERDDDFEYNVITEIDSLKRNKVETHMLEVPLEIR